MDKRNVPDLTVSTARMINMEDDKQSEMIIRIDQNLTDLNKSIDKDSKANIKAHDEILLQIEKQRTCMINQSKTFITNKLFYWVLGMVVLGIFTVAGIANNNTNDITEIKTTITLNE